MGDKFEYAIVTLKIEKYKLSAHIRILATNPIPGFDLAINRVSELNQAIQLLENKQKEHA